jgi:hypothetical protein
MRSALVQGFRADTLYAEGDREAIREEVAAARAAGLNTLRLHIKAFDPAYLEVCDELGMLLHCDIPVAEPIAHDELDGDGELADRCARAATAQVRRDANHPSVILWSAMNELGLDHQPRAGQAGLRGVRPPGRRGRPRRRPDPPPDRERLDRARPRPGVHHPGADRPLVRPAPHRLADRARRRGPPLGRGRPAAVRHRVRRLGPARADEDGEEPFWSPAGWYREAIAALPWPGPAADLIAGTQRHQGLSDRLQAEVVRRHDHLGGWCVTELTDVPWELNGLFDLERRPKRPAVAELARAGQPVLPMLELSTLVAAAGSRLTAPLHVANDGPLLEDVRVEVGLAGEAAGIEVGKLPGWSAVPAGTVDLPVPVTPGAYEISLRLLAAGREVATNTYPLRAVAPPPVDGAGHPARWSATVFQPAPGVTVVGEGALDAEAGERVRERLAAGETVVVLAQELAAVAWYPVAAEMAEVATAWGSTVFHFTCDQRVLASLPERAVLAGEDATWCRPTC